ncbi:MAG: metal-dependent hydrolase [Cytophagales bacterium]|nr:metal-dependent hydrolase [Cytophagales bacterium]
MDIITHTLSGVATGTVVMSFSPKGYKAKLGILSISGFGAALPDLDAISLWSRFDNLFGRLFNLEHSGKEIYFSKFWYSHHAFLHSILAAIIIALLIGSLTYLLSSKQKPKSFSGLISSLVNQKLILIGFLSGFIIHLIEDMPTPSCVWGGVNLFWPSHGYVGGTGDTWWWNNYDIFLIVITIIILNLVVSLLRPSNRLHPKKLTSVILIIGFSISLIQIKTRGFDFNYTGHTTRYDEFEVKSKELQRDILGPGIYNYMEKLDNKIPLNF